MINDKFYCLLKIKKNGNIKFKLCLKANLISQ